MPYNISMGDISKNFSRKELECQCCGRLIIATGFIDQLERVRELYGKAMVINSGYRCDVNNRLVGGEPESFHLKGSAVDVQILGSVDRFHLIASAIAAGATGIGVYSRWIHIDFGLRKFGPCIWTGR